MDFRSQTLICGCKPYVEPIAIEGYIINVTPELAEYWLTKNIKNNRNASSVTIDMYASDMQNGKWGLNPDAIAFDTDFNMFNGQNRLNAIVKSGKTVKCFVVFNFPMTAEDFMNVDMGKKRRPIDNLKIAGIGDELTQRGLDIAAAYLRIKHNTNTRMVTPADRIQFIEANREIMQWACDVGNHGIHGGKSGKRAAQGKSRVPSVYVVAMIDAKLCGEDENALRKFADIYCNNNFDGAEQYSPRYAIELRETKTLSSANIQNLNKAKTYLNAFCKKLQKRYERDNLYPAELLPRK